MKLDLCICEALTICTVQLTLIAIIQIFKNISSNQAKTEDVCLLQTCYTNLTEGNIATWMYLQVAVGS